MRERDVCHLVCPRCQSDLVIRSVEERTEEHLVTAQLGCTGCQESYPVIRSIPRFVSLDNYASSFGHEWTMHAKSQYDSYSGLKVSEQRFFAETLWPRDLTGEMVLEVGSGSGRFTEPAASTGAFVISFDYSYAVEANFASNGQRENVLIVQADVYAMPLRAAYFDRVFCFGVLQHTPDVHKALLALPPMLKPGGKMAVDVYKKTFARVYLSPKYVVRLVTSNMPPEHLYRLTHRWVDFIWPVTRQIVKIPRIGRAMNWRLLIPDYSNKQGITTKILKEWAYLDIFDMLSPRYDSPQTMQTMRQWVKETGLVDVTLAYGFTGIVARGTRPSSCVIAEHTEDDEAVRSS